MYKGKHIFMHYNQNNLIASMIFLF